MNSFPATKAFFWTTESALTRLNIESWTSQLSLAKFSFVVVNLLDIFFTLALLDTGRFYESNPVADFILQSWGFAAMAAYKLVVTLAVILIANIIAVRRIETSRKLLRGGTLLIGLVVTYSYLLLVGLGF